jgi:hypothetical protein
MVNVKQAVARLSVNKFQGVPETPEGIREFRIYEECFHEIPLILLLFLNLQVALNGFNTPDFPDLSYKPCFGFPAVHEARKHNISLCNQHIDLEIMSIRVVKYYRIHFRMHRCVVHIFTRRFALD